MPADLIDYVIGPPSYSSWWLWLAVALAAVLVIFYLGVFVLTAPRRQSRGIPVVTMARAELLKHRFARAIHRVGRRYRAGDLAARPASAAISREVRAFLAAVSGLPAQYMHVPSIAASQLAPAAQVLADLTDAQFNDHTVIDVATVSDRAEELVRQWN